MKKSWLVRIQAVLLAACMTAGTMGSAVLAASVPGADNIPGSDVSGNWKVHSYETSERDVKQNENRSGVFGYRDVDLEVPSVYDGTQDLPKHKATSVSRYDSRTTGSITSVKDQGQYGSCWAFSALASGESSLIRRGLADSSVDLSELQLAYFFYNSVTDPVGYTAGDSVKNLTTDFLQEGGNNFFTTFILAKWVGAANEGKAPYANAWPGVQLDGSLSYQDDYHMQNAYWLNMTDIADVKQMIMDHGAVASSYYHDDGAYNPSTYGYYLDDIENAGPDSGGHAITLVGWDDNYSRTNFVAGRQPSRDGAWLVKNSWGPVWGDNGYFWMSYEDSELKKDGGFVFVFEPVSNYAHNYQYDGSAGLRGVELSSGGSLANVFTAKANPAGAERIKAVSFASADVNTDYSIQIYRNLKDKRNPESGTPMLSSPVKGKTSYAGYYTVKLPDGLDVGEGETFSIVVSMSKSNASKVPWFVDVSYVNGGWIQFVNAAKAGESFGKLSASSRWEDLGSAGITPRIKAFTADIEATADPGKITLNKSNLSLKAGQTATLQASIEPSNAKNKTVKWSSSNKQVATVDTSGRVRATGIGTAVITAETVNGLKAACKVKGAMGRVGGLTTASQSTSSIRLKWTKQNKVAGYEVYRYNGKTKKYERISTINKASTVTYTDKKRSAGTSYKYKVRAFTKSGGKKKYGAFSSVLTTATKTATPSASVSASKGRAKVKWKKVSGASGYEVYMSRKKSTGYTKVKTIKKSSTVSYTSGKLTKGTYYYKVRSYRSAGGKKVYSAYSKVRSVKIR